MLGLAYILYQLVFFCIWIWVIITIIRKVRRRSDDLKKYQRENETRRQNAGQNIRMSGNNGMDNSHNHTYKHKIEPVDEAGVMKRHAEKQEELARKRAEREAMYNEGTGRTAGSVGYGYDSGEIVGKNGDAGDMPNDNERTVKCKYCGANNILPKYRAQVEKCYFCRLEVE